MSCTINLLNISYKNNNKVLFENVSLSLGHKQKIGIMGLNGVGKSTLLKIIAGLEFSYLGDLQLFHNKIANEKEFEVFREEIGYLPQDVSDFFLCPSVIEDVMFNLRAQDKNIKVAYKKALLMLKDLGILHLKDRIIYDLSGGEQKIVALAGILISKPRILLLDEPTNALDIKAQEKIISILNKIDKSMIIVSHHESFIKKVSSDIFKLSKMGLKKT